MQKELVFPRVAGKIQKWVAGKPNISAGWRPLIEQAKENRPFVPGTADIAIVGSGAAGLFAAVWAGRAATAGSRVVAFDGARKLGAKILVAGGGRCNVTHDEVSEADFAGSSPASIRRVLRRFSVEQTIRFFAEAGVTLKREETGKLFPVSDSARTILQALIREATAAAVELVHPARVTAIEWLPHASEAMEAMSDKPPVFRLSTTAGDCLARRVILCTGGKSLPKSGSDGFGHELAKRLGHTITSPVVPALVPLVLPEPHWIRSLSGLTLPTAISLTTASGKRLETTTGSTLCTHLGLSGPAVLDISRHWLIRRHAEPDVRLSLNWLPTETAETVEAMLQVAGRSPLAVLRQWLPERLARQLCEQAGAPATGDLPRTARKLLVQAVTATPLPVVGDRGFSVAEATAGGVPLAEVNLKTMESRCCPGLYLAGEVLDVDGRIGGFNFQWAWSSGFVAGTAAAAAVA
ncbi:MAG: NAD(P)/FAD-dependent oxidoreductase [Planctomycetia bacterium]|nr:NAD(P)/FAD-dependent oxidoreductase [Planctomycetia bacterium]